MASTTELVLMRQGDKQAWLHSDLALSEVPKIEGKLRDFKWTMKDTLLSPLNNFTQYLDEASDGFPLSPHFFSVMSLCSCLVRTVWLDKARLCTHRCALTLSAWECSQGSHVGAQRV